MIAPCPPPRHVERDVDAEWLQWIAENRLRDCTPDSMLDVMVANGIDMPKAFRAIAHMETDPAFKAARKAQQMQRKLESVVDNLQNLRECEPNYRVEARNLVPPVEFMSRYVLGCHPVLLQGAALSWTAMSKWEPDYFRKQFGHLDIEVQAGREADPRYEQHKLSHRQFMRMREFIDRLDAPSNDCYLTANNELLRDPDFAPLLDDVGELPFLANPALLRDNAWLWMGPAGVITPLHHDSVMLFHAQIMGRKRWRFISPLYTPRLYNHFEVYSPIDLDAPDYVRFPDFEGVTVLEVVAEPGDIVFLPLGWWHQVTTLETSVSLSFTGLRVFNGYEFENPSIRD